MSIIGKRIENLENKIIPEAPNVIIGYSTEEIDKKLEEFRTNYPHLPTPLILRPDPRILIK